MYNEEQPQEAAENSKLKRKSEEMPRTSRRKLMRRKIHRTIPESEKMHQYEGEGEHVMLVNPQSAKIPSSHSAMEQASQSEVPEAAYYPSPQGHNFMMGLQIGEGLAGAPEFIPLNSPQLPPMDCPEDDMESHQYQEIMQMLLQAIHNQNRIMEECRNILTSIHHAIAPTPAPVVPAPPPPPPPPPQPLVIFNPPTTSAITPSTQTAQIMPLWNPKNESHHHHHHHPEEQQQEMSISQQPPRLIESQSKPVSSTQLLPKGQSSSQGSKKQHLKPENKEPLPPTPTVTHPGPPTQPQSINLPSVSTSKESDKPTVYGPDGEFSSAYLRYVYSKSSTATSFANVLMKEVFNLEERISSNCNGVMGKKALQAERLDKIKRAVKRFYTDTEEEFQDLWKKCRKSIDSTNRNLKFVIMKKPTL